MKNVNQKKLHILTTAYIHFVSAQTHSQAMSTEIQDKSYHSKSPCSGSSGQGLKISNRILKETAYDSL